MTFESDGPPAKTRGEKAAAKRMMKQMKAAERLSCKIATLEKKAARDDELARKRQNKKKDILERDELARDRAQEEADV
jgi:hypothetical protein